MLKEYGSRLLDFLKRKKVDNVPVIISKEYRDGQPTQTTIITVGPTQEQLKQIQKSMQDQPGEFD